MLAGLAVAGGYSYVNQPTPASRQYFEANAQGELVAAVRPTSPSPPSVPRLFKPEPAFLIERAAQLKLSKGQLKGIEAVAHQWSREKEQLESAMRGEVTGLGGLTSVPALTSDLSGYSELSRAYGARRESVWRAATATLARRQLETLDRLVAIEQEAPR